MLAYEILRANQAIAHLIRENKTPQLYTILETGMKAGMITMDRSVKDLYEAGKISYEEAVTIMRNPRELQER